MDSIIIHLSDLHYREGWVEDHGVVLHSFFEDLSQQIDRIRNSNIYLAFSGDFVQAGTKSNLYSAMLLEFDSKLNSLNIPKSHRICVPGNHDISDEHIKEKFVDHEGVVAQGLLRPR